MKVLLVNPPTRNEHVPENPPLGLLYLASALRERHDVWVLDFDALKYDWEQIKNRLKKEEPDVIGITCTTYSYSNLVRICGIVKDVLPETKIIIGGPQITAKPKVSLRETRADFVVVGEGEIAIQEILNNLSSKDQIVFGEKITELDKIPFPARDLLEPDITSYLGNAPRHTSPETVMLWSRGCPHDCLFCSDTVFKKQMPRFRSAENIVEEIRELKQLAIKEIFVYDDELVGMNREQGRWLQGVCSLIIRENLNGMIFKCQGRCASFVDLETLALMKEAGFRTIMWGCESGSNKVLKAIRKGVRVRDIERTMKLCKKARIETWMFLMIGNYREELGDADKTVRLAQRCKPDYIQVTYATPYPSDFEKICVEKNFIIEPDTSKWNTNIPAVRTEYLNTKDLEYYRNKILRVHRKSISQVLVSRQIAWRYSKYLRLIYQTYQNYGLRAALKEVRTLVRKYFRRYSKGKVPT